MTDVRSKRGVAGAFSNLVRGCRIQADVIGALLMRELHTRYGRDNVGYVWMFLEPMLLSIAVTLLHAGQKSHYGSDIRPVPFAICGYSIFIMFRGMVTRAEGALEANAPLLYHRTVTIFDMMFARAILEGAGTFVTFIVLMVFAILTGYADLPARPEQLLLAIGLMFWLSFAISMLILAWTHDNRLAGRLVHPVCYILMPLSGGFFCLSWIPEPYRTWMGWSPLIHIFEILRYGQFKSASDRYLDPGYVIAWALVTTYWGIVATRKTRRRVHLS